MKEVDPHTSLELRLGQQDESELFNELLVTSPEPVKTFVPSNYKEQQQAFLNGSIVNPHHNYDRLHNLDLDNQREKILLVGNQLQKLPGISDEQKHVYTLLEENYFRINTYLSLTQQYCHDQTEVLRSEIIENGKEIWGHTDEDTYRGLICKEITPLLDEVGGTNNLNQIRDDLKNLIPKGGEIKALFTPDQKTVIKMNEVAEFLYGGLLSHIPENVEKFGPSEVAEIFEVAIGSEFGEAAEGWAVEVTKATSITVNSKEKKIRIPDSRHDISYEELRGLMVHEIGVHMLRSVIANDTNILPLTVGLPGYGESEEGIGKVMEQAIKGSYVNSGVPYYLIAGMSQHDGFDFRKCYEVMWRKNVLSKSKQDETFSLDDVRTIQEKTYTTVFRIFRGTDTIAWSKDLSYFSGAVKMWQYYEDAQGDELQVILSLLGKGDITNPEQRRVILESKSIINT